MASSSSKPKKSHHVFLNFRGPDVRNGFISHLYKHLDQVGIQAYKDDENLENGMYITSELMKAIEDSRIAIIVFSENYASSSWCLDELMKIIECRKQKHLIAWPVFYKVAPYEMRTPRESYKTALAKQEVKFKEDPERVKGWKDALHYASFISGEHFIDGCEAALVQRIVHKISTQLGRTPLNATKYPVGLESPVQELKSILKLKSEDDVFMVGIYGQGGVGKTSLAEAIYNAIFTEFQGSCFLGHIKDKSNDLAPLQEKLLVELLPGDELPVASDGKGSQLIEERLCNKKVLIILDDVDHRHQLDALARDCKWFGKGSRIIVTTRDQNLVTSYWKDSHCIYKVKALQSEDALELFKRHASLSDSQIKLMRNLVDKFLDYAKGLPLALQVVGCSLRDRGEKEWEETLKQLADRPNQEINEVLRVSWNPLEDNEKQIFLDIACFFKGQRTEYIIKVLSSCGFYMTIGLQRLIERSLISEEYGTLQMHDLMQSMGMAIVKDECHDYPEKRSRLWLRGDVLDVLSRNGGTEKIKAIVLMLPMREKMHIGPHALTNMRKLRLLVLHNVDNSCQDPIHLPDGLKWFEWPHCASTPDFKDASKNLVGLDMRGSNIKGLGQFKAGGCESLHKIPYVSLNTCDESVGQGMIVAHVLLLEDFENLKFIELGECLSLVYMMDVSCIPNLEKLNLHGCKNLERVHDSIANHRTLQELNLEGCHLSEFPENLSCPRLFILKLSGNNFTTLPTLERLNDLEDLEVSNCQQLQEISKIPGKLRRVKANNCKSLTRIPSNIYDVGDVELYSSRELVRSGFPVNDLFMPEKFHRKPNHRVVLSGEEMPKWLVPNKEGYISFVASKDLYERILGVAFCVVFQEESRLYGPYMSRPFEVIGSVNCKAAIHCRHYKFFDLDHVWLEYMELKDLWTVDHFGPNDLTHFRISIRVCNYHELLVKKCGFRLICKPLENDSEVLLQDNQLLDPALFYEVSYEDNPMSTKEKGLNMVDSSIERHRFSSLWSQHGIVSPGREMPKGFVLVEDDSISFKASQDLYNKFKALYLCVVFGVEDGKREVSFDIIPHVNGQKRNEVSGTLGSFDTDHVWLQFFRTNALWGLLEGVVNFGQFDESYPIFSLNIRVVGATIKKLGYVLQSNPLEDVLKVEIEKNCLMDPASIFEHTVDPQHYAWRGRMLVNGSRSEGWKALCKRLEDMHGGRDSILKDMHGGRDSIY